MAIKIYNTVAQTYKSSGTISHKYMNVVNQILFGILEFCCKFCQIRLNETKRLDKILNQTAVHSMENPIWQFGLGQLIRPGTILRYPKDKEEIRSNALRS